MAPYRNVNPRCRWRSRRLRPPPSQKLASSVQRSCRSLAGYNQLPKWVRSVKFSDEFQIAVILAASQAQAAVAQFVRPQPTFYDYFDASLGLGGELEKMWKPGGAAWHRT